MSKISFIFGTFLKHRVRFSSVSFDLTFFIKGRTGDTGYDSSQVKASSKLTTHPDLKESITFYNYLTSYKNKVF